MICGRLLYVGITKDMTVTRPTFFMINIPVDKPTELIQCGQKSTVYPAEYMMKESKSVARRKAVEYGRRPLNARHNQALRVSTEQFISAIDGAIEAMREARWNGGEKEEYKKMINQKLERLTE